MLQLLRLPASQRAIDALLTPFYFLFQSKKLLLRWAMLVMSVGMMSGVVGQAALTSDSVDYKPGSIAKLNGTGFQPGEVVKMQVLHSTDLADSTANEHKAWVITADASGNFETTWKVSLTHCHGKLLRAIAIGDASGENVWTEFTDPSITSTSSGGFWDVPGTWIDGVVPGINDDVTIAVGALVTIRDNRSANSVLLAGGNGDTRLVINSGFTLNVTGDMTLNSPGSNNKTNTLTVGTATLNVGGNLTISGTVNGVGNTNRKSEITVSTGTVDVNGNITTNAAGANSLISFSGAGTLNVGGNWTHSGAFTKATSTVKFDGTTQSITGTVALDFNNLTVATGSTLTGNGSPVTTATGTFTIQNGGKYVHTAANAIVPGSAKTFGTTSSYEWQGTGDFPSISGISFGHLIINSASGNNNASGRLTTIKGDFVIKNTNGGSYRLTGSGNPNISVGGNLQVDAGTLITSAGVGQVNLYVIGNCLINSAGKIDANIGTGMTQLLIGGDITINGSLILSSNPSSYISLLSGNWTVGASGVQTNNGGIVYFEGNSNQVITKTGGGNVFFDRLANIKPSGNLQINSSPATDIVINYTIGDVLIFQNGAKMDLNGRSLTLNNTNGAILTNSLSTITSSVTGGQLNINGAKGVSGVGTLILDFNVTTKIAASMAFGNNGKTTIKGVLEINNNGFVPGGGHAPFYAIGSTLRYNSGTNYGAGEEWYANNFGNVTGVPYNVEITSGTSLNFGNANTARELRGNITLSSGSNFYLSNNSGGDLKIKGNWINNGGTFFYNGRAIFFNGISTQTISKTGGEIFGTTIIEKSSGHVSLSNDLRVDKLIFQTGNTANINPGANTLFVFGNAATDIERPGAGYVNGILKRNLGATNQTYLFPVGKSAYLPASLNASSGTGTLSAEAFETSIVGTVPANTTLFPNRQWNVTAESGGPFTYNITLDGTGFTPGTSDAVIVKGDGVNPLTSFPATANSNNYTANGLTGFSFFALAAACDPPVITDQPDDATKCVGESVTFTVVKSGNAAVDYVWRKGGVAISGAPNSNTYTISSVAAADAGSYDVVITRPCGGTVTSTAAVLKVEVAPVLNVIGNKSIDEQVELSFTASATDADLPAQTLTYSLIGAPTGAGINSSTGDFTWTPTELQGGNSYTFKVRVTDNGTCLYFDEEEITVTVAEVNVAPILAAIGNQNVNEQATLNFTATATDQDVPAQTLTYTLDAASIALGMTINSSTGAFSWTPTEAQGGATYSVTITVTDNGSNPSNLSDFETFDIVVAEVNDEPSGADKTVTTNEDTDYTFSTSDFGFTDPNDIPVNTLMAVKITTLPANGTLKNNGVNVTAGQFISVANINSGFLKFSPVLNANGSPYTSFTFQVQDNGGTMNGGINLDQSANTITINVLPVNDVPVINSVTPASQTVQYSDPVSVTITASDIDNGSLKATVITGLPSGLTISPAIGVANTTGTWAVLGNTTAAPGAYNVSVTISDGALSAIANFTITVTKENADVTYTGLPYFSTANASSCIATLTLSATIKDITALGGVDTYPGNITNSTATFWIGYPGAGGSIQVATVPVVLVDAGNSMVGTASTTYNYTLNSTDCANKGTTLDIYVVVNNYYTGNNTLDPGSVTIAVPGTESVTGGGYLVMQNSIGTYAGTTGKKTNFGFTMKYTKSGSSAKGQCNIIVRRNGRVYQIKSNAITSLSVSGQNGNFSTKANMKDITDPLNPISISGNADLFVNMYDPTTGGQLDEISILYQSGSTIIYSSHWNGTQTIRRVLDGGNVQVRQSTPPAIRIDGSAPGIPITIVPSVNDQFNVKVFGNPSLSTFRLQLQSSNMQEKFTVKVVDVNGRLVEVQQNLYAGQVIELGSKYTQGTYFAEVMQGTNRKVVKLVKISRD